MYVLIVSAGKNRRLKQAKEEAQAEIEQYRLQREKEFKTKEAAVSTAILLLTVLLQYYCSTTVILLQYYCSSTDSTVPASTNSTTSTTVSTFLFFKH